MLPMVWAALGFAAGLWLGRGWDAPVLAAGLLLIALVGAFFLARGGGFRLGLPALRLASLLLGTLRGGPELLTPPGGMAAYHGSIVEARGPVVSLPETSIPACG